MKVSRNIQSGENEIEIKAKNMTNVCWKYESFRENIVSCYNGIQLHRWRGTIQWYYSKWMKYGTAQLHHSMGPPHLS